MNEIRYDEQSEPHRRVASADRDRHTVATLEQERADWEERSAAFRPPDIEFARIGLAGLPAEEVTYQGGSDSTGVTILYLHGGGYVAGSSRTHRRVTAALARRGIGRTVSIDYRLAPEHAFPAALHDVLAAISVLRPPTSNPAPLVLAGDSAGGGLVLATMLALRDRNLLQPNCSWLISPWTNLTRPADNESYCPHDPVLTSASLAQSAQLYVGAHDASCPLISPAYGDYTALAPMLVQVGARELLIDDALAVARAAAMANVEATIQIMPNLEHSYVLSANLDLRADRYFEDAISWIRLRT